MTRYSFSRKTQSMSINGQKVELPGPIVNLETVDVPVNGPMFVNQRVLVTFEVSLREMDDAAEFDTNPPFVYEEADSAPDPMIMDFMRADDNGMAHFD